MLKFGSPSITLSLLVQNCTVKAGCTVCMCINIVFDKYLLCMIKVRVRWCS